MAHLIHCKNLCKCYNVPPIIIKKEVESIIKNLPTNITPAAALQGVPTHLQTG
jgi:hypothetical protein